MKLKLKLKQSTSQSGQTIIEILIATGVVAMVMTAVAAGLTLSIKNSSQSKYRALGGRLAQEGVEVFRRERDRQGWESFYQTLAADGATFTYCLGKELPDSTTLFADLRAGSCSTGFPFAGTDYTREAVVQLVNPRLVRIRVTVTWYDGATERTSEITQELQDWR